MVTTSLALEDNSTICDAPGVLSQMQIYADIAREATDSIGAKSKQSKAIVKRDANIHPPGQWPGVDFDKKPRYERSGLITVTHFINIANSNNRDQILAAAANNQVRLINNQIQEVTTQIQVETYRFDVILAAQIGPYVFS